MTKTTVTSDRVGLFLKPQTRNRLNKFKADLALERCQFIPLDKAINELLDHYIATTSKPVVVRRQPVATP